MKVGKLIEILQTCYGNDDDVFIGEDITSKDYSELCQELTIVGNCNLGVVLWTDKRYHAR